MIIIIKCQQAKQPILQQWDWDYKNQQQATTTTTTRQQQRRWGNDNDDEAPANEYIVYTDLRDERIIIKHDQSPSAYTLQRGYIMSISLSHNQ